MHTTSELPQAELFTERAGPDDPDILRRLLSVNDWMTRRQIKFALGWSERRVRAVAEVMGKEVVRGQHGFKLANKITRGEVADVIQAADAAISQGKKMIQAGIAWRRFAHELVG